MRIFACHLLNDFSGSPKVLRQLIKGWISNHQDVVLLTSNSNVGFLSNLEKVKYININYKYKKSSVLKLLIFLYSQFQFFFKIIFNATKKDVVYINTVLPFGAAIAAKLKGARVIYHLHETSIKPAIFKKSLFKIVEITSNELIYVSKYLADAELKYFKKKHIIPNAIEDEFLEKAQTMRNDSPKELKNVLMIGSLKRYKGIFEYISLAKINSNLNFVLVLNATQENVDSFSKNNEIPSNLIIYSTQTNLHPFFQNADVLLNLSRPDMWIETFGLTVIEAMAYGLPSIVPPIGGISEIVIEGETGFKVDSRNIEELSTTLNNLLSKKENYLVMQQKVIERIKIYKEDSFILSSLQILKN